MEILYTRKAISKPDGTKREILIPSPELLQAQRSYLHYFNTFPVHARACAYVDGGSPALHASYHQGQLWVITLDIKGFFDSFRAAEVSNYFVGAGLAREEVQEIVRHCTYRGHLPQGAATSPVLSNLLFFQADNELARLAERLGFNYSRYSDDLAFSSHRALSDYEHWHGHFAQVVQTILLRSGFRMNFAKVKMFPAKLCGVPLTYSEQGYFSMGKDY